MAKIEKKESIEDIFTHLKTIVNENPTPPEPKKKNKPSGSMKLGIIIIIIILLLGIVISGYFFYKAKSIATNPNDPGNNGDTNDEEILIPIYDGPYDSNNNDNPYYDPNNGNNNDPTNGDENYNDDNGGYNYNHRRTTDPCSNLGTVTFNPSTGVYNNTVNVALSYSKADCDFNIYYTTNGAIPTNKSTRYVSPITVESTQTINAAVFAKKRDGTSVSGKVAINLYVINRDPCDNLGSVVFNFDSGDYTEPINVELRYTHPKEKCEFTIRYTKDGIDQTKDFLEYKEPITISYGTTNIKAAIFAKNLNNQSINGPIITKKYTITQLQANPCANLGTVKFTPSAGTYTEPITVDLIYTHENNQCNHSIRYTLNGLDPNKDSTKYTGGGIKLEETTTIKAAVFSENSNGEILEKRYTINIPVNPCANLGNVIFTPKGGYFMNTNVPLYLAYNTINPDCITEIHYTTDGTEPKSTSPEYHPGTGILLDISQNAITVKAAVFTSSMPQQMGPVRSETYKHIPETPNK